MAATLTAVAVRADLHCHFAAADLAKAWCFKTGLCPRGKLDVYPWFDFYSGIRLVDGLCPGYYCHEQFIVGRGVHL